MEKIKDQQLAQLLVQLRFSPKKKRQKQLYASEELFSIIEQEKDYPFEFICFKITGYHPKSEASCRLIKGNILANDLRIFISKLSGDLRCRVSEQSEKVYTLVELADKFNVSTKTIHRWRRYGLVARKFIYDDRKKRLGFLQSSLDNFFRKNPEIIAKAKYFTRLSKEEKQFIIKRAAKLSDKDAISRYQVIEKISEQINRSHEAVRYTISSYEKSYPDKKVFKKPAGVIKPVQAREIYKLFKQRVGIPELMNRFSRSKGTIYRIIQMRRAKAILAKKIEFIDSDEFLEEGAKDRIIGKPFLTTVVTSPKGSESLDLAGSSLPRYLESLKKTPSLNREEELELFRRYNYLKYLSCVSRAGIKPYHIFSKNLEQIEGYLEEAETIKKMIIEANLQLVVTIANRHAVSGSSLLDLISEGNVSLMNTVEKFDYTRGFRFATYASWAIAKDYARKIPAEVSRLDKPRVSWLENIQRDLRTATSSGAVAVESAGKDLVQAIRDNLNEREQYIIINHFGLLGSLIKKQKKTLKQIGDDLGITKERVRQIELVALQKLRHYLTIEEFELLTG